jgi:hypothetical protein
MVAALMAQNGLAGLPHHLLPRNGDMASLALLAQQQQQAAAAAAVAAAGMDAAKMEHLLRMHGKSESKRPCSLGTFAAVSAAGRARCGHVVSRDKLAPQAGCGTHLHVQVQLPSLEEHPT